MLTPSCKSPSENNVANASEIENTVTTYYLIRHAEKDRSNPSNQNPDLSEKGEKRAENYVLYFKDIPLDAIYSTDVNRTQQTVEAVAEGHNLTTQIYEPGKLYSDTFLAETKGKSILIVGHSNTIPQLVNKLVEENKYSDIDDNDNSKMFIVTMKNNETTVELHTIN